MQRLRQIAFGFQTPGIGRMLIAGLLALGLPPRLSGAPDASLSEPVPVTAEYVTRWVEVLRTNHPALRAATARVDAAQAEQRAVRAWEDPMFMVGGMVADREMRADDGDLRYGVRQTLPLFGLPRLRRDAAAATQSREAAAGSARFQELRRDLAQAMFTAAGSQRALEIGEEDLTWLANAAQTADQRYRTGAGSLVELLRLQNEQAVRTNDLETTRLELAQARAVLNRLLSRPLDTAWPVLVLPPVAGPVPYSPQLAELAETHEPTLQVLRQAVREREAVSRVTRRTRWPEVSVGVEGRNFSGTGEFRQGEVTVEFTLPWGNRRRYGQDYARDLALTRAAEQDALDYQWDLRQELHGLVLEIETARRNAQLQLDEILPRSERALASAQAAWATDRGTFYEVMEARRMVLESRRQFAEAVTRQHQLLADLILCCGLGDLEALRMLQALPKPSTP